jgi:hypothetical protein
LTLTPANGTVAQTTISARISAGAAAGNITDNITATSTGGAVSVTQNVAVTGTVTAVAAPTITVSPASLTLVTTVGSAGTPQTYTVSGNNLTAPITITSPGGVELSSDGGATYHSSLTLTPINGSVAATINVRITAAAATGEGVFAGTIANTSTGATEQDVTFNANINPVAIPTIVLSTASLNLGTTTAGTAGPAQTFDISGSNLTGNILITAPAGVELSSDGGATYHSSLTLTPVNGTVDPVIDARISAGAAAGAITGNIVATSPGATEHDIAVTGTVTAAQQPKITSANHATFTEGIPGTFTITTSGFATLPTITEAGALPAGIIFQDNGDGTATLKVAAALGTAGTYHFSINAGNVSQLFTLTILPALVPPQPCDTCHHPHPACQPCGRHHRHHHDCQPCNQHHQPKKDCRHNTPCSQPCGHTPTCHERRESHGWDHESHGWDHESHGWDHESHGWDHESHGWDHDRWHSHCN